MHHFMIDLETLDTKPSAVILSVGVVLFDPVAGTVDDEDTYYLACEIDGQMGLGRTVSGDTLRWWALQNDLARHAAFSGSNSLPKVLQQMAAFLNRRSGFGEICVWGNGATFDISILEDAYRSCGHPVPWSYRSARDLRTLYALSGKYEGAPIGTAHNALDDALFQALGACWAHARLRGDKTP